MFPTIKNFFTDQTAFARFCKAFLALVPLAVGGLTGLLTPEHMHDAFILSAIFNAIALAIPAGNKNSDPAHTVPIDSISPPAPPKGFISLPLLIALAIGALLLSFGARADAPAPVKQVLPMVAESDPPQPVPSKFGGCVGPYTCFQPSAVVVPLSINLRMHTVEAGFQPGVGYGVTFHQGEWYAFGVDVYLAVNVAPQTAAIAVLGKAVNGYLRFGWSKGWIGDSNATAPRLLVGIGSDL